MGENMATAINCLLGRSADDVCGRSGSIGLLILRVSVGLMMAFGHGLGKLTGFGENAAQFPDPLGIGSGVTLALMVFAEFFCSLALVVGLATRAAAIPLIIAMAVAVLVVHSDDPFSTKEKALLYLIPFLAILFTGPGRYSLDALWHCRTGKEGAGN